MPWITHKFRKTLRRVATRMLVDAPPDLAGLAHPIGLEDVINVFAIGRSDLFFLQIGANDGATNDPISSAVRRHGLRGCLVEPQPLAFERLKATYAGLQGLIFENAAIADREGTRPLYSLDLQKIADAGLRFKNPTGLASFDRAHVAAHLERTIDRQAAIARSYDIADFLVETAVPTTTVDALLRKHAIERVDLLMIDVEGYDFEVIKGVDVERYRPSLIIYEHIHLSGEDRVACWHHLSDCGYQLAVKDRDTVAYRTS